SHGRARLRAADAGAQPPARPRRPAPDPGDLRALHHHPERAARDLLRRFETPRPGRHRDREPLARGRARGRLVPAHHAGRRGADPGRPAAPHRPPVGGARLPRDLRRPGDGRADGHRQPAALRPRDGAVARHRRGGRRLPGHPDHVQVQERARPAALRLRGRDHRRARVAVGHARGRRGARHRPDRGREAVAGVGDSHRAPGVPGRAAAPAPGPLHPAPENLLSPPMRPSALQIERTTRASRLGAVVATLALIALLSLPAWGGPSAMRLLVLAQMWNLLAGYAGLVSIGQQAYVGLGGYALIVLADDLGVDPFVSVPLAGLVAAALALPTAALVFRFHGGYFAG